MQNKTHTLASIPLGMLAAAAALTGCGGSSHSSSGTPGIKTPTLFTTVDSPGGAAPSNGTTINGISNSGTLVGLAPTASEEVGNANFIRSSSGTFTALTALNLNDPLTGMANAVNTAGTVVGVSNGTAFTLTGTTLTSLTPPGSTASVAFGISDGGTIVGQFTAGAQMPGFVLTGTTFKTVAPPSATVTNLQGVNNQGQAIGFFSTDGVHQHGFLYNIATQAVTVLPDPSTTRIQSGGLVLTQFLGLNDNNEAVGYYQTNNGSQFGFLFNLSTQTYTYLDEPLAAPVSGVQVTQITGVANSGEICGFFIDSTGTQHGFFATP